MKRLVIAIDCDDVLVASTRFIIDTYNKAYDTSVQLQSAHVSGNPDWQAERDEVHRRIRVIQLSEGYGQLAPSSQAIEAINQLAAQHEIHLVTARSQEIAAVTQQMVDLYFPNCFTSIEHTGFNTSKEKACLAIGAQLLVDDNLKHLLASQSVGVESLFWFGDYPWQDKSILPRGITATRSWPDVLKQVEVICNG